MKPFCQFCKTEGHWGNNCPRLKATSHGAPRVETHQLGAYETPPPRRRPMPFGNPHGNPRPISVTDPKKPPSEAKAAQPVIENLQAEIKHLKAELAARATRIAELENQLKTVTETLARVTVTPVTVTESPLPKSVTVTRSGRPTSGNALTAAEKQRAYRARKTNQLK